MNSEPPLIAHVIFRLDVGGLENGVVNLVNNIPESRYRQVIICLQEFTDFRKRLTSPNVRVIALHKKQGKDPGIYFRLWKIFRELRPDIVHTRNLGTIDAVFPAAVAGVRHHVHGEHGWDMVDLYGDNRKYRLLRRACNILINKLLIGLSLVPAAVPPIVLPATSDAVHKTAFFFVYLVSN